MNLNTYGFNRINKQKAYVSPNGRPVWIDHYILEPSMKLTISSNGQSLGKFHKIILDWNATIANMQTIVSDYQVSSILSKIEVSGIHPYNLIVDDDRPYIFVRYNSASHVLTFMRLSGDNLDGQTINDDTYWKVSNSTWPWSSIRGDITKIVFQDEIYFGNIASMSELFYNMTNLEQIVNINNIITTNVTNMNRLFCNCSKLKYLNLSAWDTSSVTNMNSMFEGCSNLEYIEISSFSYHSILSAQSMFKNCSRLQADMIIDTNSFDFSSSSFVNVFSGSSVVSGSVIFIHFTPDSGITQSDIANISSYIQTTYSSSNIDVLEYHDKISPDINYVTITLDKLLNSNNKVEIYSLAGNCIVFEGGIIIPLYFDSGLILSVQSRTVLSGYIDDPNNTVYIDSNAVYFSSDMTTELVSQDMRIELTLGGVSA